MTNYSCAMKPCVMTNCRKIYFVFYIFVVYANQENFAMKISRSKPVTYLTYSAFIFSLQCEQLLEIVKALEAPSHILSFIREFYRGTQVCMVQIVVQK